MWSVLLLQIITIWVKEHALDATKLYMTKGSDVDDLLTEAARSDKFLLPKVIGYNAVFDGKILWRDTIIYNLRTTLDNPLVIAKMPEVHEPEVHECK